MKRTYETPEIKITEFAVRSVILASDPEDQMPEDKDAINMNPDNGSAIFKINSSGFGW